MAKADSSLTTRDRILDAAESLFGDIGFDGTPVRLIAKRARANIAAVNYHFGTKEELYKAVFFRRIQPLNTLRLALLHQVTHGAVAPTLEAVLHSFIHPTLDACRQYPGFVGLMSRNMAAPPPFMSHYMAGLFRGVTEGYCPVLQRLLPHRTLEDLFWTMQFIIGSLLFSAAHQKTFEAISEGICRPEPLEKTCLRLVNFAAAGLRATTVPSSP